MPLTDGSGKFQQGQMVINGKTFTLTQHTSTSRNANDIDSTMPTITDSYSIGDDCQPVLTSEPNISPPYWRVFAAKTCFKANEVRFTFIRDQGDAMNLTTGSVIKDASYAYVSSQVTAGNYRTLQYSLAGWP